MSFELHSRPLSRAKTEREHGPGGGQGLWKRAGKTRRIDKAMSSASVHGCRFMPALVLECRKQPLSVSRRFTPSKVGITPAIPESISDQHRLVFIT